MVVKKLYNDFLLTADCLMWQRVLQIGYY